jgi:amino-acid N-acetyltransferase
MNIETLEISFDSPGIDRLDEVQDFLQPFIDAEFLLPRTRDELSKLLKYSFVALQDVEVVGFAALEIYSAKLAEIQCLAVAPEFQRRGVGRGLVHRCVEVAKRENVKELMAISASDAMFVACGFDYSLPNQKRALFISPQETDGSKDNRE